MAAEPFDEVAAGYPHVEVLPDPVRRWLPASEAQFAAGPIWRISFPYSALACFRGCRGQRLSRGREILTGNTLDKATTSSLFTSEACRRCHGRGV